MTDVLGFSHIVNDRLYEMNMVQCAISPVSNQGLGDKKTDCGYYFRAIPINGPTSQAKRQCAKD